MMLLVNLSMKIVLFQLTKQSGYPTLPIRKIHQPFLSSMFSGTCWTGAMSMVVLVMTSATVPDLSTLNLYVLMDWPLDTQEMDRQKSKDLLWQIMLGTIRPAYMSSGYFIDAEIW